MVTKSVKKFAIILSIFTFLLILAGCSNILPTYNVSGIVVDQDNRPLNDAVVSINSVGLTKTNYKGSFLFLNVRQGSYEITISKSGYHETKRPLVVNQNLTTLRYTLYEQTGDLTARASGKISFGSVLLAQNKPLPNKKIILRSEASPKASLMSLNNHNGVLVQFNEFLSTSEIEAILAGVDAISIDRREYGLYKFETNRDVNQVMDELRQIDGVEAVQPNHINHLMSIPNDEDYFSCQWNLELINMPEAWNYAKGEDSDVIIAVLDTGIRYNSDLEANIGVGYDVLDKDNDPYDDITPIHKSHGTHMASIIGAMTNNGRGLAGVGWNLRVMPIKICYAFDEYENPVTEDLLLIEGIRTAVDMGADIINISLGNSAEPDPVDHILVEDALRYADSHGVAVFAAAGNDGRDQLSYPASSNYTFAIGAVNHNEDRAFYSNYGYGLDLVAPGGESGNYHEIFHGIPGYSGVDIPNNSLEVWPGTSSATAHVSAVAGLIHSLGVTNPETIYQILCDSATDKHNSTYYGAGLLNAGEALMLAANVNPINLSAAQVSAAKRINYNTWEEVTGEFSVNVNGDYSVAGIPADTSGIYIIAKIDVDGDGQFGLGDYFGYTPTSYTYQPGEYRSYVDFSISKITSTAALSALMNDPNKEVSADQKIEIIPMQK